MRFARLTLLALIAALGLTNAGAIVENGCVAAGPTAEGLTQTSCSYTAQGAGEYVAPTMNPWQITVLRGPRQDVVLTVRGGVWAPGTPMNADIATQPGDTVRVSVFNLCAPLPQCGTLGGVAAGDQL